MLLTKIPYFREIILMSFSCDQCGFTNTEVQSAGQIQERGAKYTLKVMDEQDMQRQLVKSDTAVFRLEDFDIEMPAGHGQLTIVEGIMLEILKDLESGQKKRKTEEPEVWEKIDFIVQSLLKMTLNQKFPFTITLDDPSGNSWIEPSSTDKSQKYQKTEYPRTGPQNAALGLADAAEEDSNASGKPTAHVVPEIPTDHEPNTSMEDVDILAGQNYSLPTPCPGCTKEAHLNLQLVNIPYFKEVVVSAVMCLNCNYRSSDVKTGGEVPRLGKKIYLDVREQVDLRRDILKSETCCVKIVEVGIEVVPGTMGGRFTTVEGLLTQIRDDLRATVFEDDDETGTGGDSMPEVKNRRWNQFFAILNKAIVGGMEFTIELEDPLGNSYVQSLAEPPAKDDRLREEEYQRSEEEENDLGISDMRTRMGEGGEYEKEEFWTDSGGATEGAGANIIEGLKQSLGARDDEVKEAEDEVGAERAKAAELIRKATAGEEL